jgi:SagB-type dehydrogenase family enzyme
MTPLDAFFRWTEMDRTTLPQWRERLTAFGQHGPPAEPRRYPGLPCWSLPRARPRLWARLDSTLLRRRCLRELSEQIPTRRELGRVLQFGHALAEDAHHGPAPSAGAMLAVELYLVVLQPGWLPAGLYHYDRRGHHLAQLSGTADEATWRDLVPSLVAVSGGGLLWVLVGDGARVAQKYGPRGYRFLLLEAGHVMQNLCLLCASLGLSTVPLGGFLEREVADAFLLPGTDLVLYLGACGVPRRH